MWDKFSYGSFLNELRMSNVVASFLWKFAINLNDKTKKKSCYTNDFYYYITTVGGIFHNHPKNLLLCDYRE